MLKAETYKLSEYLNIVNFLLEKFSFNSVFKIEISSLIIYYQMFVNDASKNTNSNFLNNFFKNLHNILLANYLDFVFITQALEINEKNKSIYIDNDLIKKNESLKFCNLGYFEKDNLHEALREINAMSNYSFAQEVIEYV